MKNSLNFGFVILLFVILGCSCPKLDELKQGRNTSAPVSTPVSSNSASTPTTNQSPENSAANLTMAKYEQIKTNMKKSEVESILGGKGTEVSSSSGGGMTFSVYKWEGENYASIILTFKNDKVMSKSQYGLK